MAALQDDDVRVFAGGLHELLVHGLDGGEVLGHHGLQGPAPVLHVPQGAAEDADVGVRLHEDLDVEHLPQDGVGEDEDALHDDDAVGLDLHGLVRPVVVHVGVDRALDGAALHQRMEVLDHEVGIEGVRMVVVLPGPLLVGLAHLALIVAVVADDGDVVAEVLLQVAGQGGLAAAGAAGDADENGIHQTLPLVLISDRYYKSRWPQKQELRRQKTKKSEKPLTGPGKNFIM